MAKAEKHFRIAAVADLHCTKTSQGAFQSLLRRANDEADILLLCGDLTDHGLPEEAEVLAKELTGALKVPVLAVFGNHDFHSDKQDEIEKVLTAAGVHVLDGDEFEINGVGFAGVKGFGGGFGRHTLDAWGESVIKQFVYEAVEESLKLEKALARLSMPQRVAVLHYAPILDTVVGEPESIYPFLGSSRLEDPLNRYGVTAIFHGHAHHGSPEGKTREGIPVYNVSVKVLRQALGNGTPFRVVKLPLTPEPHTRSGSPPGGEKSHG